VTSDDPDGAISCTVTGSITADADGDGYDTVDSGGDDCDDEDPLVNPGMEEVWYNGIDENCDGASDYDQDGDGYESSVFNEDPLMGGGDCQDVNPNIHPGAPDAWYDGADTNCDGINDYDADADTWTSSDYGGEDCDDTDPSVNPEGAEVFNGEDDDCDGKVDDGATAAEADVIIYGDSTEADEAAGRGIAIGDWDGNGEPDLTIGVYQYNYTSASALLGQAQGGVAVFFNYGWSDGDEVDDDSDWFLEGESESEMGNSLANVGDWDGDGIDDLAVGAWTTDSKAGRVYLFSGADVDGAIYSDAIVTIDGKDDYRLGYSISEKTDLNGDGYYDLLAFGVNSYNVYNYLAVQYGGGSSGAFDWADIDGTWKVQCGTVSGSSGSSYCGASTSGSSDKGGSPFWAASAHGGADIDGDGYHDLIIGDPFNDDVKANSGSVWILWGRAAEYTSTNAGMGGATLLAAGPAVKDYVGAGVTATPDVDGDGAAEIWVNRADDGIMYYFPGGSYLRDGDFDLADDSQASLEFGESMDDITSFANVGDWTGDGIDDTAIVYGDSGGSSGGFVYLLASKEWSGAADGKASVSGEVEGVADDGAYFGHGVPLTTADLDDNGAKDMVVGDYGYSDNLGGIFIFLNNR
jgi:hypothetical protein